jgi:catechol 2,3-dioxygenase
MEIKELGHLVLYVRDIDRSSHFYREVLGWRQIVPAPGDESGMPIAAFTAPGGRTPS